MRRLSFLLRPGWLALTVVVLAFAGFCFSTLAPWQLGKNTATDERNARISASFDSPPAALTELAAPGADAEWRLVSVTGSYLAQEQVLARLRSVDGRPAYEVLTPFRTDNGRVVLVNRGYVRPVEGTEAPPVDAPPTGQVTLQGRLRQDQSDPSRRPILDGVGGPQVYAVDAGEIGRLTGLDIAPGWVQLSDGQPGGLGLLPLPQLDSGPFLSYGLQWIAFGIMAPLGLAYFVRAELRERGAGQPARSRPAPPQEAVLADRYGKRG